jgi:hypothetical protein
MRRYLNPFALAVLACLILAGWALWSGGILDGKIAKQVRTSSVYAAPGTGLDRAAAERVVGNRRLVVILLAPGSDLSSTCHGVQRAAEGTLVLVLSRKKDGFDKYGCASFGGDFGKSFVSEQIISQGVDGFEDEPLGAVKVAAVNYDLLVKAGSVPDGARTISPSLPRYLIAGAAVLAVLLGSAAVYAGGRTAGRLAASRRENAEAGSDARRALGAATAVLAQQIIDLDRVYGRPGRKPRAFRPQYRQLASDYTDLMTTIAASGTDHEPGTAELAERVEALSRRCRALSPKA